MALDALGGIYQAAVLPEIGDLGLLPLVVLVLASVLLGAGKVWRGDPRNPAYTVGMKLNLPPSYLLIHRTWLAGVGVLCQLECEAPFRQILTESLPGFAGD